MAKNTEKLDALIELARAGKRPTHDQISDATPTGSSVSETKNNRRLLTSGLVQILEAVGAGLHAKADDIEDDLRFGLDADAQRAATDELVAKIDRLAPTPSVQERHAAGKQRLEAKAQLDDLLNRAANGEKIKKSDIRRLAIAEHVTDEQLGEFTTKLTTAIEDVRERRGDLGLRDGRHARAEDAAYAADRYVGELLAEGIVAAPGVDHDKLPDDPRELASMIPRTLA